MASFRDITERLEYENRLEVLHSHADHLGSADSVGMIAEKTLETVEQVLGFGQAGFGVLEEGHLNFILIKGSGRGQTIRLPLNGEGVTVRAVNTGETQLVPDVRLDKDYVRGTSGIEGYRPLSELAVPVKKEREEEEEGEIVAVINLESEELDAFTQNDRKLVETLAMHVSSAFTRIRKMEETRESRRKIEALHRHGLELQAAEEVEEVFSITRRAMSGALGFEVNDIPMVEDGFLIDTKETEGEPYRLPLDGPGGTSKAARTGDTQIVPDTREDPDYVPGTSEIRYLSELAVPVKVGGEVVAVLNVESRELDAFTMEDAELVEVLAGHVTSAMSRLTRLKDLKKAVEERTRKLREAYKELKELDRMKNSFMAMATHELRTPLTSIKGYVDLIRAGSAGEVPERINDLLEVVERNTERLSKITEDLLDQQRLESGEMDVEKEPIHLKEMVMEVAEEVEPMLEEKNQALEVCVPDGLSRVEADNTRISQVMVNLLNNAWRFSPEETTITLEVAEEEESLMVSVSDEGIGLTPGDIDKLFKPFPEIERPTVTEKSTGLGLSICKGIVELHGGEIWAVSEGRGEGSTFGFTLPKTCEVGGSDD